MNEMTNRFAQDTTAVLTPEILSASVQVVGQAGVFLIKGFAREVRAWPATGAPRHVYGTLQLGPSSIRFKTDALNAPTEGEAVILAACLEIKPPRSAGRDRWNGAFEVTLIGEKAGTWSPGGADRQVVQLTPRADRLPLEDFLDTFLPDRLTILVSGKAEADIQQAFTEARLLQRPKIVRARFDDETAIIEAARQAVSDGAQAVALARGGGAGLELTANSPRLTEALIGLGKPFYSAQGHGDDVFLIDKHADDCFATPSVLGLAVARGVTRANERRQDREALGLARQRAEDLEARLDASSTTARATSEQLATAAATRRRRVHVDKLGVSLSWPVAAGVVGALALLFALTMILAS
jgi:exodeoxyribonuclease VII large subunit